MTVGDPCWRTMVEVGWGQPYRMVRQANKEATFHELPIWQFVAPLLNCVLSRLHPRRKDFLETKDIG